MSIDRDTGKANDFAPIKTCIAVLAEKIRSFTEEASIEDLMEKVGQLLDESIATKGYVIHATEESTLIDLSQIDFDALKAHLPSHTSQRSTEENSRTHRNDHFDNCAAYAFQSIAGTVPRDWSWFSKRNWK
jgi:hypothetical protein